MAIAFPDLPYAANALEPHMSARTFEYHHGKHHRTYVDKLNQAIAGTDYEDLSLEEIITRANEAGDVGVFNNAAQAWNHDFLWRSLSPAGGGEPTGTLREALEQRFGGLPEFRKQFTEAALTQFGSGWAWLVLDSGSLKVVKTSNAGTPLTDGATPLLTLDVWEHAYYLDYQNERPRYVATFLDHLINWDFAAANFEAVRVAA